MAYTTIDDPSAHHQILSYAGTNSSQSVTFSGNSNLQPDWIISKKRGANGWNINDSTRGYNKFLAFQENAAETTWSAWLTSSGAYDSDGITMGSGDTATNASGGKHNLWCFKANAGTTSTDTNGDIDTTVQVNQTAGFSIVTYSPPNDTARTIGHGLGAVPKLIIIRARNRVEDWHWFHYSAGTGGWRGNHAEAHNDNTVLGDTLPTSTVYKLGTDWRMNGSYNYVGYFFADVQGYSKFGSYKGNGNVSGPFVYTGFQPSTVIIKETDSATAWGLWDWTRSGTHGLDEYVHNPRERLHLMNTAGSEYNGDSYMIDFYSNGFKLRNTDGAWNGNNDDYIYAAWAKSPFVTSDDGGSIPGTAV